MKIKSDIYCTENGTNFMAFLLHVPNFFLTKFAHVVANVLILCTHNDLTYDDKLLGAADKNYWGLSKNFWVVEEWIFRKVQCSQFGAN